jgi:hypothetical protein
MSLGRIKPRYISLNTVNDTNDSSATIDAVIKENYGYEVIDKANSYVCAVERMEISLNGIPFYKRVKSEHNDGQGGMERIICHNRNVPNVDNYVNLYTQDQFNNGEIRDFFNLKEILDQLSEIDFPLCSDIDGLDLNGPTYRCEFTIDEQGYIRYSAVPVDLGFAGIEQVVFSGAGYIEGSGPTLEQQIIFPPYLNMILGLGERPLVQQTIISDFPRFDMGDELAHILLVTSLPVISDSIGQELQQVLTDFAPTSVYSGGYTINGNNLQATSLTLNSRQKLIYVPAEKRYLDLTSPFNIREIRIDAYYVTNYGKSLRVPLPLGGMFQVKIGFYTK